MCGMDKVEKKKNMCTRDRVGEKTGQGPEKEIAQVRKKKKLAPGSGSWRPATFGHYGYPYPAIAGRVGASVFLLKS